MAEADPSRRAGHVSLLASVEHAPKAERLAQAQRRLQRVGVADIMRHRLLLAGAFEAQRSGFGADQPGDNPEEARFSRPVRAGDGEEGGRRDAEGESGEDQPPAADAGEIDRLDGDGSKGALRRRGIGTGQLAGLRGLVSA
jgi:hypothetical protein